MTPHISVILSVYNQARYLPAVLTSFERQDAPVPFELIVCDDGSVDETRARLAACTTLDVRHVWQPNRGFRVARSRNNGIRVAQGDVLVFMDGDMIPRPRMLRDHWDAHQSEPGSLVCASTQNVQITTRDLQDDGLQRFERLAHDDSGSDRDERLAWMRGPRPWMACTSGNMSIERHRTPLFDERFQGWGSEDRDFAYRAYAAGLRVALLDGIQALHLWVIDDTVAWNPTKGGDNGSIVSALRSKLALARKYPGDLMAPSLELVRYCHHDPRDDRWTIGGLRPDVSVAGVLAEFEAWLDRHESPSADGDGEARVSGTTPTAASGSDPERSVRQS
jgi:glycosyltransferase involved in cell wall biosynthesis